MIKTTSMLIEELANYRDPFGKIKRLCKGKKLFPITRGIYETDPSVSGYLLAPVIYGPSYLSFDYALAHYGLIPEVVREYTSATCCKGKKKSYHNIFGDYSYQDIPADAFPFESRLIKENGYFYSIATPEKALCDKLYELSPVKSLTEIRELLFENMRLNRSEFEKLDKKTITELSEKYRSNNVRFLAKYIRRQS